MKREQDFFVKKTSIFFLPVFLLLNFYLADFATQKKIDKKYSFFKRHWRSLLSK